MILGNLISNAVKYNRDGGRVDVGVNKSDRQVTIAVADNGIGMTEKDAKSIFNEFVRIKSDKTANILGSGLGLSIVKKLAQLYGGNATVTSIPEAGSVFTVELIDEDPKNAS
jgi:signal transduction histidine kinase